MSSLHEIELSEEQQFIFNKYSQGHNIFITGPGGSGKSLLIQKIYHDAKYNNKDIHVTATTGCAAILLQCSAKTLHSWAGVGLAKENTDYMINKLLKNRFAKAIWKETDILIIDEVSMLSQKLFEMLNQIGKALRKNNRPFGGIQVIACGDFYQLPPVGDKDEPETMRFCFESDQWNTVFPHEYQIELTQIFRQKDPVYTQILHQIREGKIKRRNNELLLQYVGKDIPKEVVVTKLFPKRAQVDMINNTRMNELISESHSYELERKTDIEMTKIEANIRGSFTEREIEIEFDYLSGNLLCEKKIQLKIGAQVMSIINIKTENGCLSICNGSQGIITQFIGHEKIPVVKFNNGLEIPMPRYIWTSDKIPGIGVSQIPLILAWALTIHKSQGSTLDNAEIDAGSGIFECGQTYVALSRVKSLEGLYLTSFDASRIRIHKKVREYYENLRKIRKGMMEEKEEEPPVVFAEVLPEGEGMDLVEVEATAY